MKYTVTISTEFAEDLDDVRAADRKRIRKALSELETHAEVETKRRKKLDLARLRIPLPFAYQPPVWQFSVGDWRVFYDVIGREVRVQMLRFKEPHKTTEEIL